MEVKNKAVSEFYRVAVISFIIMFYLIHSKGPGYHISTDNLHILHIEVPAKLLKILSLLHHSTKCEFASVITVALLYCLLMISRKNHSATVIIDSRQKIGYYFSPNQYSYQAGYSLQNHLQTFRPKASGLLDSSRPELFEYPRVPN